MPAIVGGTAAVGLDILLAYVPFPAAWSTGWYNYFLKILGSLGLGWVAGALTTKRTGQMVAIGALTVSMYSIIAALAAGTIGSRVRGLGGLADFRDYRRMGAYMNPRMGAYLRPRMGAILPGMRRPLGAYMNPGAVITRPRAVGTAVTRAVAAGPRLGALAAHRAAALAGVGLGVTRIGLGR